MNNTNNFAIISDNIYSVNKELDDQYKQINKKIPNRLKNLALYNFAICFGYYYAARNIVYFRRQIYGKQKFSFFKIIRSVLFYTLLPAILLVPNLFILFGSHPIKYFQDRRDLEDKLLMSSEIRDTIFGLEQLYKTNIVNTVDMSEDTETKI